MLQRCQFLSPCYCMRMKKLKEQKSNSRQNADQYFPADCKMRQSKKSCQISCKPEQQQPSQTNSPYLCFHIFPHSTQNRTGRSAQSGFSQPMFFQVNIHNILPFSRNNASIVHRVIRHRNCFTRCRRCCHCRSLCSCRYGRLCNRRSSCCILCCAIAVIFFRCDNRMIILVIIIIVVAIIICICVIVIHSLCLI